MADADLIARVYPTINSGDSISKAFQKTAYYVAPLATSPQADCAQGERAPTEPPVDHIDVPDHHDLPCVELRFSDIPPYRQGIVFGIDPKSDVVLPRCRSVSHYHFSLTFDEANRFIVKDLGSRAGTQVTYTGEGLGTRSGFQWIVGGHPVIEDRRNILITIFSLPLIQLEIIVAKHDIKSPEYIKKVDRFRQGSTSAEGLFANLDIPSRPETRQATGAHTPDAADIFLKKEIGQGSFGVVTHYWNVSTGAEHALKEPSEKSFRRGLFNINQWRDEEHLMKMIDHPNIVRLLESNCTGRPYLRLEYVPGGSLADQQDISVTESVLILRQCLAALEYLHGEDIVHRDINNGNILVKYRKPDHIEVKLADFGLSKDYSNLSTFCGNPLNRAPEVYMNEYLAKAGVEGRKCYNSAVDIWSLGTVVYGLLCPFPAWNDDYRFKTSWAEKLLNDFGKDFKKRPNELKHFLLKAMVVMQPNDRWSAEACRPEADRIRIPVPGFESKRATIRNKGEQSNIVQNSMRRATSPGVASGLMAAQSSGAPPPGSSVQTGRKRTLQLGNALEDSETVAAAALLQQMRQHCDTDHNSQIAARGPQLRAELVKKAEHRNSLLAPAIFSQLVGNDLSTAEGVLEEADLDAEMTQTAEMNPQETSNGIDGSAKDADQVVDEENISQNWSDASSSAATNAGGMGVHDDQSFSRTNVSQVSYFTEAENGSFLPQMKGSFLQQVHPQLHSPSDRYSFGQ